MAGKVLPEVIVGGANIGKISNLHLDQPYNGHHFFTVVCPLKEQMNTIVSIGEQYIGKDITISLNPGYILIPGRLTFKGIVTNVKLSKHEGALMQLMIQGYSPTRLMDDGPHYQSWKNKSIGEIADIVAGKYKIETSNTVTYQEPLPYVSQYRETTYRFLERKMATFGQWFYYDGEKLVMGTPEKGDDTILNFGKEMSALDLSADIVPPDFKLLGYDYVEDEHFDIEGSSTAKNNLGQLGDVASGAATEVFTNKPQHVEPFYAPTKYQLEDHAKRRKSSQEAKFVNLFGQSSHLGLKVGQVIVVKSEQHTTGFGAGLVDYGSFRIIHLTHSCDAGGAYTNNFQAIPSEVEVPPTTEATTQPVIAEHQPAVVIDNKDPEGLGRLQVQFPWQKVDGEVTPWIRVSTAGAGGSHGIYFTPEIGDQVLVGFTWNNPDRPIVVGSLYNKSSKHGGAYDQDNNSKIIKTRSGNRITLSDLNGEESIKIENGTNVMTFGLAGDSSITVETAGDLIMRGKTVAIHADTTFTLSSNSSKLSSVEQTEVFADGPFSIMTSKTADIVAQEDMTLDTGQSLGASAGDTCNITAKTTNINGDSAVNVQGGEVNVN